MEWVDFFANPVFKNPGIIIAHKSQGASLNSLKIFEMSLIINNNNNNNNNDNSGSCLLNYIKNKLNYLIYN